MYYTELYTPPPPHLIACTYNRYIIYSIYRPSFGGGGGSRGMVPGLWPADIFEIEATAHFCALFPSHFFRTATAHFCNLYKYFIHYLFYTHIIFFVHSQSHHPPYAIAIAFSFLSLSLFAYSFFFVASFCALYKYCINFVFIALFGYSHLCIFDGIVFGFRSTNFSVKFYAKSLEFMPDTKHERFTQPGEFIRQSKCFIGDF